MKHNKQSYSPDNHSQQISEHHQFNTFFGGFHVANIKFLSANIPGQMSIIPKPELKQFSGGIPLLNHHLRWPRLRSPIFFLAQVAALGRWRSKELWRSFKESRLEKPQSQLSGDRQGCTPIPTYPVMGNPYISPITRGYLWVSYPQESQGWTQ